MSAVMEQWNACGAKVVEDLVDFGTPLTNGVRVSPAGPTAPSQREVAGYSFIDAESLEVAVELAKQHPHLPACSAQELPLRWSGATAADHLSPSTWVVGT